MLCPSTISLLAGLAAGAAQEPEVERQTGTVGEESVVPLLRAHGLCFVEVDFPDGPVLALVDTGANASAVDPRRSSELPLAGETEVLGTTGAFMAELVELAGLAFGGIELPTLRATRRDLAGLLAPAERTVEMILGSDALVGRAVTFDFSAGTLTLGPSQEGDGAELRFDEGIPALEAELAGVATWLRIDTGASLFATPDVFVNVPERLWRELSAADPSLAPVSSLQGTGADGTAVDLPVVRLRDALLGPRAFERVFLIVQPEAGYFARADARGFVSNNLLEKLGRVTLDYGAGRLRIAPR